MTTPLLDEIMGPFGDRLQKLTNIEASFKRLKNKAETEKQRVHQVLGELEKTKKRTEDTITWAENMLERTHDFMDQCDHMISIIEDTELFKEAKKDWENLTTIAVHHREILK